MASTLERAWADLKSLLRMNRGEASVLKACLPVFSDLTDWTILAIRWMMDRKNNTL